MSTRNINKEKKQLPETIYLVPDDNYWSWCDEPAPSDEHIESEAVKYIRVKD